MNIRARLLIGFLLVIVVSAMTGIYSTSVIDKTSALTKELYDQPLMASSFALTATLDFERADRTLVVAALGGAGAGLRQQEAPIAAMEAAIGDDLGVVEQRFPDGRGGEMVGAVRRLLADWDSLMKRMLAAGPEQLPALLAEQATLHDKIEEKLDIVFRQRSRQTRFLGNLIAQIS